MKTKVKHSNRKTFYKLLDSFEEKDFYAVKNFAEFIKTKNGKETLKEILSKVPVDNQPLSDEVLKRIEESRDEIKNKKYKSLNEVMRNYEL
jgi:hypothetical protein